MDWEDSSVKLLGIMRDRAKEIRKRLPPADNFIEAVSLDLVSSGVDFSSCGDKDWAEMPDGIQMTMIESLINSINKNHGNLVREFVMTIGEILDPPPEFFVGDAFLGEDDSSIFVLFERMQVRIGKDVALKILTLEHIPD